MHHIPFMGETNSKKRSSGCSPLPSWRITFWPEQTLVLHAGVCCAVLRCLVVVRLQGFGRLEGGSYFDPWGLSNSPDRVLGGFDKLGGALMGNIFAELLRELQSGLDYDADTQQQEDSMNWHGRMDRFFGELSQRLGEGLEQQLGDQQGLEEQLQGLQQLLQRELKATTPPDVISWLHDLTDQEADQQGLGAEQQCSLTGSWEDSRRQHQGASLHPGSGNSRGDGSSVDGVSLAAPQQQQVQQEPPAPLLPWQQPSAQAAMRQLEGLGAAVYLPTASVLQTAGAAEQDDDQQQQWGVLAGYEAQKQALEDCLLLPLKHPEVRGAGAAVP